MRVIGQSRSRDFALPVDNVYNRDFISYIKCILNSVVGIENDQVFNKRFIKHKALDIQVKVILCTF